MALRVTSIFWFVLLVAASSSAGAEETPLSGVLTIYYNPTNQPPYISTQDVEVAIMRATNDWNTACNLPLLAYGGIDTKHSASTHDDGQSVVGWEDTANYAGLTRASTRQGVMIEAHVALVSQHIHSRVDLRNILLHEFGHVVGLDHSSDPRSIMYPRPDYIGHFMFMSHEMAQQCQALYGRANRLARAGALGFQAR